MSETLKALGQPAPFEWRGQTYQVSPVTLKIEGLFADGCRRRVEQGLRIGAANLGETAFNAAIRQHNEDLAACEYEFMGRICQKALASATGTRELAYLCLKELQPFDYSQMDMLFREPAPAIEFNDDGTPKLPLPKSKFSELVDIITELRTPHPNG